MITQPEASAVLYAGAGIVSGHRMLLVSIAMAKHALALEGTADQRLKTLLFLEGCSTLGMDVIAAVAPASAEFMAIVSEVLQIDPPGADKRLSKSYDVLTSDDVFTRLMQLNAGIVSAIAIRRAKWAA
jgi:hypothetical protein